MPCNCYSCAKISMYTIQLAMIPPPQVPTPQAEGLFCAVTLLQLTSGVLFVLNVVLMFQEYEYMCVPLSFNYEYFPGRMGHFG